MKKTRKKGEEIESSEQINISVDTQEVETEKIIISEPTEAEIWKDKYFRLFAEFDNYKKRVQKEKSDIIVDTRTKMLNSILDLDNDLHIAKKSIGDSDGLNLILQKVHTFLKSQGIDEIQTEVYDEDLHEVISVIETGNEKIIDVVSKGYKIGDKPIRYPKIILSK